MSPSLLFSLAHKNSIPLPTTDPAYASPVALAARCARFANLQDFLDAYFLALSVLRDAADFERLAWEYFVHAHRDGVAHAELFFDPQSHTARGVPFETVLRGYRNACRRAETELGISSRLILCFLRHLPVQEALETWDQALGSGEEAFDASAGAGAIVGVGLDSTEVGYPPGLFRQVYEAAGARGLRRTAHGGEEGDPAVYIRGALDELQVERIDHGVRIVEDPELMQRVVDEGVLLTVCPLSNVCLQVVKDVRELPIREFLDKGVKFSINSDDPAYFGGYVLENYCAVQDAFELSVQEWTGIAEASVNASWIGGDRKEELLAAIRRCVEEHGQLR